MRPILIDPRWGLRVYRSPLRTRDVARGTESTCHRKAHIRNALRTRRIGHPGDRLALLQDVVRSVGGVAGATLPVFRGPHPPPRFPALYAQIHGKSSGRLPEDEVTSCLFGPLRMMAALAPERAWAACRGLLGCGDLFPEGFEPTEVDVRFWPRFPAGERAYIEPDIHIIARRDADVYTILVEVKCGANLGSNQLLQQWTAIQVPAKGARSIPEGDELRRRSAHVLLGYVRPRHRSDIDDQEAQALVAGVQWGDRLITATWGQFAVRVQELPGISESMRAEVLEFLRKALDVVPVPPFNGIEIGGLVPVSERPWFFRRFDGVRLRHLQAVSTAQWAFPATPRGAGQW